MKANGNHEIKNLTILPIKNFVELGRILEKVNTVQAALEKLTGCSSKRVHTVFQLQVQASEHQPANTLTFVELAGSEKLVNKGNDNLRA